MADTAPMGKDEAIDLLRDALEHYQRLAPDTITAREALRMTAHLAPSTAPTKDHVVRDVVNRLRDTALEFHAHGSLRERLARELEPLLAASHPADVDDERQWVVVGGRRAGRTFLAALARDAERYRWMRNAQWFKAGIAKTELNASSFHYSGDLLDQLVDARRAAGVHGEGAGK